MLVNLKAKLNEYFGTSTLEVLNYLSDFAERSEFPLYIVGGIVRDLLLGIKSLDIDLLVEGDALEFVEKLPKNVDIKILQKQPELRTAKVLFNNSIEIDFASTREENYPQKGQLPVVSKIGVSIKKDSLRRDFTVNCLLISLNKANFGDLIDDVGGYADLQKKELKILHDDSFIDDPTRIIRGLKFAIRFNMQLEKRTAEQQEKYLQNINRDMCYSRVKSELVQTFCLNSAEAAELFVAQNIYRLVSENINKNIDFAILPENISKYCKNSEHIWLVYFAVIFACDEEAVKNLPIEFTACERLIMIKFVQAYSNKAELGQTNSAIYNFFAGMAIESVLAFYCVTLDSRTLCYLDTLSKISISLTGEDLIALGLPPSPAFKAILAELLDAKLDGKISTKDDEINFVKEKMNLS